VGLGEDAIDRLSPFSGFAIDLHG
ncbi:MAG: hypothetical protein RJA96_921, partial [Actinomycetota bacterium]